MEIYTTLAGLNFRPVSAKEAVDNLTIGDEVTLVREPENPYDANAVQVHAGDEFIGFIPKVDNLEIAEHLANGGPYKCEVVSFLATRKPGFKVTLIFEKTAEDDAGDE